MYEYNGKVERVYDGDTITVRFQIGFHICILETVRLYGIDAPEMRGTNKEQGRISRDRLRALILDKEVIVKTYKDKTGKYGRYLADVYIESPQGLVCVNDWLVKEKLAVYREY